MQSVIISTSLVVRMSINVEFHLAKISGGLSECDSRSSVDVWVTGRFSTNCGQ